VVKSSVVRGRTLIILLIIVIGFLSAVVTALACSWDYPIWMIRSKSADPLYRFVLNEKAGYINGSGRIVIQPTFRVFGNSGDEFHNGLMEIAVSDGRYVDTTGKLVIDKGFYRGWDFSEGLAVAMRKDGEKWGFIDHTGQFAISPRFDGHPKGYPDSFSEGLAKITVSEKVGYVDRSGEFVIKPQFLDGTRFKDGMARVVVEGPCEFFGDGPCPESSVIPRSSKKDSWLPPCQFTYVDKSGTVITTARYERAKDFSEGLAPVRIASHWGYIDKSGILVIPPQFDEGEGFCDGLARVKQGKLYGYVDHNGDFAIPLQFPWADDFADGLASVGKRFEGQREFWYINTKGRQAIPGKFALASHFFKGLAHVKLLTKSGREEFQDEGTFAYINTSGKIVFEYIRNNP
jgi:WG containing repeat